MSDKKRQRRYKAIETLEDGIRAYLFINAVLENYTDEEHEHCKIAKFVAKATLNELLYTYEQNNGPEALQTLADRINTPSGSDNESIGSELPSV